MTFHSFWFCRVGQAHIPLLFQLLLSTRSTAFLVQEEQAGVDLVGTESFFALFFPNPGILLP